MIKEISNFIQRIDEKNPEVFKFNLEAKFPEGLYLMLDIDENGEILNLNSSGNLDEVDYGMHLKKDEMSTFLNQCLNKYFDSIPAIPGKNKSFNPTSPAIFIDVTTPLGIGFTKKNIVEKADGEINQAIENYFKSAKKYSKTENENTEKWNNRLELFAKKNFLKFLKNFEPYQELGNKFKVIIFLKTPSEKDFKNVHQNYLSEKVFVKQVNDSSNRKIENIVYGPNGSTNVGNLDKKPFKNSQTTPFDWNRRISGKDAGLIWQFFQMQKNRQLPNPMPIFIDHQERTRQAVATYQEDGRRGYSEIIKAVIDKSQSGQIGNYYLIFFQGGLKGSRIIDLDFVSAFRYKMEDMKIREVIPMNGRLESEVKIKNVFDFERFIVSEIFNNVLIDSQKGIVSDRRYFSDLTSPKGRNSYLKKLVKENASQIPQILSFRKSFYDYIYKSKRECISQKKFNEILEQGMLEDIRKDEYKNNQHSQRFRILKKLNIWFSLYEYFDYTQFSNPLNDLPMASKIENYHAFMDGLVDGSQHIEEGNDSQFAFAAGQVIAYLFTKSRSSDRSYSRLEPFLQKRECTLFKSALLRFFEMYKHENFSNNFKKPFAEVMAYDTEKDLKDLTPIVLAGFFSENKLFSTTNK